MHKIMVTVATISISSAALGSGWKIPDFNKENIGTAIGVVTGGAAGNKICNEKYKNLCTVVGASLGGLLGNSIGKKLDEQDRQRQAEATAEVLAASNNSQQSAWTNPQNGTSGSVRVVNQHRETKVESVPVLKDRVEKVMPLELIGEIYTTDKTVNVRVGPGQNYKLSPPPLQPNSHFNVVGRVIENPQWLMVADNGAGSGYVYAPLVKSSGLASANEKAATSANVSQVSVNTVRSCKTINHEITYKNGKKETETVEMCQRGDGSWDIV